jgi:hypothetical protein
MLVAMAKRKDPHSKRSRGEDRHTMPRLAFHMPQELFDAFKAHVESLEPRPHESEVLRVALKRYLESVGAWPRKGGAK